ncbi:MAG TPA: hypothetical protein VFE96_06110, partial [Candidatus Bathyarchaeia archaeon]|nr:hypothetical protein [Candidatus Bathyarchaeia archaeon]
DFGPGFLDRLYDETEGNALFALETLKLLLLDRAISRKDNAWILSLPISRIRIPDKVKDVLARRLARLGEEDRRILELASVIGDTFESSTLQEILSLNRLQLLQALSSVERIHSLIEGGESVYRFTHSKVRDVIYDQLSPGLRQEYHSLVAEWIERKYLAPEKLDEVAAVLANHFLLGHRWEKALAYFAIAGDMAMQIHAHEEAIQSYSHALEALGLVERTLPIEIGSSLHERNAMAALASGKINDAMKAFDSLAEAVRAAGDQKWYGKAKFLHGWASFWNKDLETTLQDCAESLTIARRVGDKTLEGRSLYLTGTSLLAKGLSEQAKAYLDDSLRISREAGDKVAESQVLVVQLMEGLH